MPRLTLRRTAPLLALATAAAVILALTPALAQSEEEAPVAVAAVETAAQATALMQLTRRDTLATGTWEMAVDEVFTAVSPTRVGYSEVWVGITMKNISPFDVGYRVDGFFTDPNYPRLSIIDASGTDRPLLPSNSIRALLPGSMLSTVPPGMTGRWTAGFQVPSAFADDLELTVTGPEGTASFDLATSGGAAMAGAPSSSAVVSIGDAIDWSEGLSVSAFDHGSLVCGDPETQLVMQIVAVGFEVGNRTAFDVDWPGVRFPENLAIAQWADGATARFAFETFVGDSEPLLRWAEDATRIPAGGDASVTHQRAMLFAVPRDGRVVVDGAPGEVDDGPIGLWLRPPGADAIWLDLDGPGELPINPALCDEGNFAFTIPYAFGPGPDFVVGLRDLPPDPEAQDLEANQLLLQALVAAGNYKADNADSYEGLTAAALAALWDAVSYRDGFVADVGAVGVSTEITEEGETFGILVTESAGGRFFCLVDGPQGVIAEGADSLEELRAACSPVAVAPAEEPAADTGADADAGTDPAAGTTP